MWGHGPKTYEKLIEYDWESTIWGHALKPMKAVSNINGKKLTISGHDSKTCANLSNNNGNPGFGAWP